MATLPDFNEAHVLKFTETVGHLLQQKTARLRGAVQEMSCFGENAQSVMQLSEGDMGSLASPTYNGGTYDGWYGDTEWDNVETYQRWIMPAAWKRSLPIHKNNLQQMLTDPRSSYAENIVAAHNRRFDDTVITAALGDAKAGRFDSMSDVALPAGQKILNGGTGLTIDKLLDTWQKLREAEATGEDGEGDLCFVTNALGLRELLDSTEVKSSDYNTVKALAAGEIDTFAGFKFIRSQRVTGAAGIRNDIAFVKSGITVGIWDDLNIRVDERPDKNYTWQIYGDSHFGAVRNEDKKVVQVDSVDGSYV